MAVEAQLKLLPPQLITNRDFINSNEANLNMYNTQMGSGVPFAGAMTGNFIPFHQSLGCDSIPAKTSVKAESGVTYNLPLQRKRSRDSFNQYNNTPIAPQKTSLSEFQSFLGEDISFHIQQQQLEIAQIVTEHTKKVRLEFEERQKQHARLLISAIGEGIMKKLKEKDEQIQKMDRLNLFLQERVKSLYMENQLWRDLAQTNEATANSLRTNLEQVLAHVADERLSGGGIGGGMAADDAESCCDSSDSGKDGDSEEPQWRKLEEKGGVKEGVKDKEVTVGGGGRDMMCKKCGERESCVLLLPCRHLCLCTHCGSTLHTCPVCSSTMNASVHVNMS